MQRCFLDIDGVLADFAMGVHRKLGIGLDYSRWPYERGPEGWGWHGKLGMSFEQLNELCDFDLWAGLPWTDDGRDILRVVLEYVDQRNVTLLTTPMPHVMSASGKVEWVKRNLPGYQNQICIFSGGCTVGGQPSVGKELFARIPGSVLIDDCQTNVDRWIAAGGNAVLVPRPWNWYWTFSADASAAVKQQLERLCHAF